MRLGSWVGGVLGPLLAVISLGAATRDAPLADAAKRQDKAAVGALLKQRVDVNAPQGDGATALHWTAHWNDLETTDLLLRAGAKVNAVTDLGVTPLYLASETGSVAVAERLLKAGANPNLVDADGVSPLMLAARSGALGAVQTLLTHKANANAKQNSSGQTALMWAVAQDHPQVVRALAEHGADVHLRSMSFRRLVNNGGPEGGSNADEAARAADGMRAWTQIGGSTALLFAARNGSIECARALLAFGANVNDTAPDGNSALVMAAHSGRGALARFLLDNGADPNADAAGHTVLHVAVLRGDLDLVKASLARGANPNVRYANGTPVRRQGPDFFLPFALAGGTPFLLAAKYASVDIMSALAAGGADPRLATRNGTTPLMAAASADHRRQGVYRDETAAVDDGQAIERQTFEAVRTVLEIGADVNAANDAGDTALHTAASARFNSVIQLLAENGATLEAKNKRGQTPLALASGRGRGAASGAESNSTADLLRQLGAKE